MKERPRLKEPLETDSETGYKASAVSLQQASDSSDHYPALIHRTNHLEYGRSHDAKPRQQGLHWPFSACVEDENPQSRQCPSQLHE